VWRPTGEGEMPVLMPMEHHADTSELVQMLQKGHHGVTLDEEEWDRIVTWIDMNAPFYGQWQDAPRTARPEQSLQRRRDLMLRFAFVDWQLGWLGEDEPASPEFIQPEPVQKPAPVQMDGWPLEDPAALQKSTAEAVTRTISLPGRQELKMVWVPPGSFVMGSLGESPAEWPQASVKIEKGFWMSATEVDNRTYNLFDPDHHSRFINQTTESMWSKHLRSMNGGNQPVVRVSWQDARGFCQWLSEQTGESFDLPTEAQWEWAARAGSDRGFPDWSPGDTTGVANCAGVTWGHFYSVRKSLTHRLWNPDWDDKQVETDKVTANAPNAWGLHNMHGNAAEWTRSLYRPYPYDADDGRNEADVKGKRVVRGGSFSDRPRRCTASYRLGYHPWQGVYNVGFRVIIRPESQ
jgi:formylglycine-generating enzyme required for sulfatase activity